MKFKYLLLLTAISSFAANPSYSQLPEPLVLDTLPPKPSLEDKLKAKSKDFELVRKHVDNILFRDAIANTELPRAYPVSAGIYAAGQFNTNALSGYDQLLLLSRTTGNRKQEAEALSAFGDLYALKGDLDKSVQYYKEALQVKEKLKNNGDIARTSFRLASVLGFMHDYQDALTYYDYTVRTASAIKQPALQALAYVEIGKIKQSQNDFAGAEHWFMRKALPLYTRYGNKQGRIICFENLAKLYQHQKRYSEAKWYYIQANLLGRKINNEGAVISSLINLGNIKNVLGHFDLALQDFKEAEKLASLNNDVPKLIEIKSNLGDLYHRMGNFKAADKLIDEYSVLRDTLMNTGK